MIRVLVMANESFFADFIVSALSQEADMDVFRVTRDEFGRRRDYSVVIAVDDGMAEDEPIKLKEYVRKDLALLLVRVSLKNKILLVDENYKLVNPGMEQVVDLVREFSSKRVRKDSNEDNGLQKKLNEPRLLGANNPLLFLWNGLVSFSLHFIRRRDLKNVTRTASVDNLSGFGVRRR